MELKIDLRPLNLGDVSAIVNFTDQWIGKNYYQPEEVKDILQLSMVNGLNASFGALNEKHELIGVRLTFGPGEWVQKKGRGLTPKLWKTESNKVAYFKSLFVREEFQKHGIGRRLSETSIEVLKKMGARAILCHSWLESPGNSSQLYLSKMGFVPVAQHDKFWHEIDYSCTRCGPARCVCTAMEMIKYLK